MFFREILIKIAFQCLQLVVTDFLPVMPWRCLPLCVNTAAKFGSQTQELNISLTAVGLMVIFRKDFFFWQTKLINPINFNSGTSQTTLIKIKKNYHKL